MAAAAPVNLCSAAISDWRRPSHGANVGTGLTDEFELAVQPERALPNAPMQQADQRRMATQRNTPR